MPVRGSSDTLTGRASPFAFRGLPPVVLAPLTSARHGGGRERLYAATRGKVGKRLAFGLALEYTSLHQSLEYTPHNQ